jgi:hypothetical protein
MVLFRPVGIHELRLIAASGFSRFPPRLPHQPIFYPVLEESYAVEIARDWNTKDESSGFLGFVTRFEVDDVEPDGPAARGIAVSSRGRRRAAGPQVNGKPFVGPTCA